MINKVGNLDITERFGYGFDIVMDVVKELNRIIADDQILLDVRMKDYTSMRVGGNAKSPCTSFNCQRDGRNNQAPE